MTGATRLSNQFTQEARMSVEISGWDTIIFTFTPPHVVFERLLAAVLARWPAAIVDLEPAAAGLQPVAEITAAQCLKSEWPLFHRDTAMAQHMQQHGYAPMADGDGPFAVIVRERKDIEFEIAGINELQAADHQQSVGQPPSGYHAWLCGPLVYEITAVTPSDPTADLFSACVLAEVKRAVMELVRLK
jgi:hypothetical protein